jgi:hypothetical protein
MFPMNAAAIYICVHSCYKYQLSNSSGTGVEGLFSQQSGTELAAFMEL